MTTKNLKDLPRDQWSTRTVAELAEPCGDENTIEADADATSALSRMSGTDNSRLIVSDHGNLRGIVSLKDMMKFISLKVELED